MSFTKIKDGYIFKVSTRKDKKYDVFQKDGKKIISFGGIRKNGKPYEQFRDIIGYYKGFDHNDKKRREKYYNRHGARARKESAKWFSHKYLW